MSSNKKHKRRAFSFSDLIKIFLILVLILIVAIGTLASSYVLSVVKNAPEIQPDKYRELINETSKVYDDKGQLIQTLVLNEFSEYVPLERIPEDLQHAAIAIEDERFYEHSAVDFKRILGATIENIKAGRVTQGGSTLTMQLAKNLYTNSQKSYERKLTDIYYAYEIESKLSKNQVLEAYLNSASFSKGTVGVQAAAKTFFNKDVSELNLAECALVAGITNRPAKYSPYNRVYLTEEDDLSSIQLLLIPTPKGSQNDEDTIAYGKKLAELGRIDAFDLKQIEMNIMTPMKAVFNPTSKERQELILKLMLKQGYIDQAEYDEAKVTPINISIGSREEKGVSSFYVDEVKNEAIDILINLGFSPEEAGTKLYTGGFNIYTSMDLDIQKHLEETVSTNRYFPGTWTDDNGILQPQVAAVLMDPHNGKVKGLIGGRNIAGGSNLNRATTPRSPGSSIKPISSYMTAFKNGATAADVYLDAPLPKNLFGSNPPKNVGNSYVGWTTIRNLLVRSSNVGSILVARDIGADFNNRSNKYYSISRAVDEAAAYNKIMENLEDLGVTSLVWPEGSSKNDTERKKSLASKGINDSNASAMALGGMTLGISPLEMAGAYTSLANEGIYQKPTFIDKITNSAGEVIYENKNQGKEIISPQNAFILTNILEDVVKNGTGRNANFSRMHIAGKTGTTNDNKDIWFVGYTPYYLCSVFIGNDKNEPMPYMSSVPASLWKALMEPIHDDLDDKEFEMPEKGIYRKYSGGRYEYFVEGTSPHYTNKYSFVKKKKVYKKQDNDNNNNNNNNDDSSKKSKKKSNNDNNN